MRSFAARPWTRPILLLALMGLCCPTPVFAQGSARGGSNKGGFGGGNNNFGGGNKGGFGGGSNPFGGGSNNKGFGGSNNAFGGGNKGGFGGSNNAFGGGSSNKGFGGGSSNKGFGGSSSNKGFGGSNNAFGGGSSNKGFGGSNNAFGGGGSKNSGGGSKGFGGSNNAFGGGSSNKGFGGSNNAFGGGGSKNSGGGSNKGFGGSNNAFGGGSSNKGFGGSNNAFGGGSAKGLMGNNSGGNKSPGSNINKSLGNSNNAFGGNKNSGSLSNRNQPGMSGRTNNSGSASGSKSQERVSSSLQPRVNAPNSAKGLIGSQQSKGSGSKSQERVSSSLQPRVNAPNSAKGLIGSQQSKGSGSKSQERVSSSLQPRVNAPNSAKGLIGSQQSKSSKGNSNRPSKDGDKVAGGSSNSRKSEGKSSQMSARDASRRSTSARENSTLSKSQVGVSSRLSKKTSGERISVSQGSVNFRKDEKTGKWTPVPSGNDKISISEGSVTYRKDPTSGQWMPLPPGAVGPGAAGGGVVGTGVIADPGIGVMVDPGPTAFRGEEIAAAIITGIATAVSMAQGQGGDLYMDEGYVDAGGGFIDEDAYFEDGGGVVVEGGGFVPQGTFAGGAVSGGTYVDNSSPQFDTIYEGSTEGGVIQASGEHQVARPELPEVIELLAPEKNRLPNQVTVADVSVGRKLGAEIDRLLTAELDRLIADLEEFVFSDARREELFKQHVTPEMDAAQVTELKNALIDLDAEKSENAAKKLGLPTSVTEEALQRVKLSRMLADLKKLVRDETSPDKVEAFQRRFDNSLGEYGLSRADQDELRTSVTPLIDSLVIRLSMITPPSTSPGTLVAAPEGSVPVLYYPPLAPAGKVYLLGGSVLALGSATPGALVVGRSEAAEVMGVPRSTATPIVNISADKARTAPRSGSVVVNPRNAATPMSYTINGGAFTIKPGESQHLPAGSTWVIAFDRGDGSQARYTLGEGTYAFTNPDGARRDIMLTPNKVTLENPSLTGRFLVVVDNESVAIPAGQALSMTSDYPIVVGFDRGDGGEPAYKRLYSGTYSAEINSADGYWDLFEFDPTAAEATPATDPLPAEGAAPAVPKPAPSE